MQVADFGLSIKRLSGIQVDSLWLSLFSLSWNAWLELSINN